MARSKRSLWASFFDPPLVPGARTTASRDVMGAAYEHLNWRALGDAASRGAGVLIPLGAIEQHGFHLPVDTDAYLARDIALSGSEGRDFLVAPLMPFGYRSRPLSGGGPTFPGTISLSGATFVAVVQEIVAGFLRQGFRRLVIYVWHMENQNFAYEAAYTAVGDRKDIKVVVMESPFDSLSDPTMQLLWGTEFPGWAAEHAAVLETSLMLYRRPELVDMTSAVDDRAPYRPPYDIIPHPDSMTTSSGTLYRATLGTREKGEVAFTEITNLLQLALDTEFPELAP